MPVLAVACLAFLLALAPAAAIADSGFYLGGSAGMATVDVDFTADDENFGFDEDDFAWKLFGGYVWDLPLIDLGVEAGYVDFGKPSASYEPGNIVADGSGVNLWGVAGFDLGPFGVFGKVGAIAWDFDGIALDEPFSDDGTDPAYGIGAKFMLWSLEARIEYEYFDVDGADRVDLLSAGLVWVF
jgi:hypothetical protein